ncbi:MAG TPA: class I SAM-dependent methyltransferase [Candidatus Diapherotrites archaeon]|uniref:Class I SAM-dependent methyltransferase n=1 Tax=Candidatus Iainarchaeum sp. TaxID=3101447 RepID=A0A7J4JF12_9ARCH|nr:class I SAM-dependent methyltransferase [Candidatus Diapherotrites archaeon]HIH16362.1 class I SAM-dependent methyltransferase [Candidatus Diapherotrites archaeon]
MDKTKEGYFAHADAIWAKRFESPNPLRRYAHRQQYASIVEHVPPHAFVLDTGCGEGVLAFLLAHNCRALVAVDLSCPNIQTARRILSEKDVQNVYFVVADAENLPFKDNGFDCVVSSHVLEHLPDFDKGLREIWRVTNSRAVIAVPTCLNLCSMTMIGGGRFWELTLNAPVALLKGVFLVLVNLLGQGVYEKYACKEEFPHLWQYPWVFLHRLRQAKFQVRALEASTLCIPYLCAYLPFTLPFQRLIDKLRKTFPLNYFGYGTTAVALK